MEDSGGDDKHKLHIVVFPWLAFGHMIPFLELSKLIVQKGHRVSFVSTPKNIDRLPKLPPSSNLSTLVNFVKLPLPRVVDNLPENAEATIDLPYEKVKYLKKAYDELEQPITKLMQDMAPDWVIHDFASYWIFPIASRLGISTVYFSAFPAATLCFVGPTSVLKGTSTDQQAIRTKPEDFTVPPKWIPFESTLAFRPFEAKRIFDDLADAADDENITALYRMGACIEGCDVLAVRSSYELETEWLKLLEEIYQKPVIPVGQLPPATEYNDDDDDGLWSGTKKWLNKQSKGSVVYVAFGSESRLSQTEVNEIALGLELSGFPFFWVLRKRHGAVGAESIELPDGFEERTEGRGIVCTTWAPQLKILSHDSVGGFITHSGCSSVVEAIQFEKPLIALTFLADTGLIARGLEEKKMAYMIPRDDEDGFFTRNSVAESLRFVMVEERGKIYRDNVKEMKGLLFEGAMQEKYINNLLDYLMIQRSNRAPLFLNFM